MDPTEAYAWFCRSSAYRDLGEYDKAVADFSRAVKLDPKYTPAWSNRGAVYSNHLGQHEQAVADFTQAIALDPKYADPLHNRGVAYGKLNPDLQADSDLTHPLPLDSKAAN